MSSSVIGTRVSAAERRQIENAADRLGVSLSQFTRQAALKASARIERKVSVKASDPPEPEELEISMLDEQPERVHYVDGEPVVR